MTQPYNLLLPESAVVYLLRYSKRGEIVHLLACCASDICVGSIVAFMCRLIVLSKLFSRNDEIFD